MKRIQFITLGCKVNQYETETLRKAFLSHGYIEDCARPDICIVNTCTVTGKADRKSRAAIVRAKKNNPQARIIVTGCLAELDSQAIHALGVDMVVSQTEKNRIPSLVFSSTSSDLRRRTEAIKSFKNTRAFVKIQDGCDKHCTFCKIRLVRPHVQSRSRTDIFAELEQLQERGCKEIVLCGINMALYGQEDGYRYDLAALIQDICQAGFGFRIRLSSLDPASFRESFFGTFSQEQVCPFLHLSFQSGDDAVLAAMNKKASVALYEKIVQDIRAVDPDIAIAGDIIIGFPVESEPCFRNTFDFIQRIQPMRLHIFPYSVRSHKKIERAISPTVIARRVGVLKELSIDLARDYAQEWHGKVVQVLVEQADKKGCRGTSENYLDVHIPANPGISRSQMMPVKINKIEDSTLYGHPINVFKN